MEYRWKYVNTVREEIMETDGMGPPPRGSVVRDNGCGRLGRVMDHRCGKIQLRPLGGGLEWDAAPEELEPVSRDAALRAAVGQLNAASRTGLL